MIHKLCALASVLCRERVVSIDRHRNPPVCTLANRTDMRISSLLALNITIGDDLAFPIPMGEELGAEVYVTKGLVSSRPADDIYQAQIGTVTQPMLDKRRQ